MKKWIAGITLALASSASQAAALDDYFGAIDLTTVVASITALGVIIVGIRMSEKGIVIAKRLIGKV